MTYQNKTGCLNANSHPGSYTGQDAYADMLVTENRNDLRNRTQRYALKSKSKFGSSSVRIGQQRPTSSVQAEREREREKCLIAA